MRTSSALRAIPLPCPFRRVPLGDPASERKAITAIFVNRADFDVDIFWVDQRVEGKNEHVRVTAALPGGLASLSTHVGHRFVAKTSAEDHGGGDSNRAGEEGEVVTEFVVRPSPLTQRFKIVDGRGRDRTEL